MRDVIARGDGNLADELARLERDLIVRKEERACGQR